jgi:hypothetical protein
VGFLLKRPIYPEGDIITMADELRIGLAKLLRKARMDQDADFLKEGVRVLSQALMEMEVEEHGGASRHERSPGRMGAEEGRSWLFSGILSAGQTVEGILGLLWLIPLVGFVAVSWGYLTHQGWWPQIALVSAAISLEMIVLWWGGLVMGSAFFALVFDLAVIAVVLWHLRSGAVIS